MTDRDRPSSGGRTGLTPGFVLALVVATVVPLLVTVVVPHDVDRVLLPAGIMLIACGIATLLGGWLPGLVGALLSITLVDYFYLRPHDRFGLKNGEDAGALLLFTVIVLGFSVVLEALQRRAASAAAAQVRAEEAASSTRRTVVTLQETLLPHHPPDFDGVDIECRYVSAGGEGVVGGDWYAVVPISPTHLGVAIGDVAGHGLLASQVMAEIRFALRGLALGDVDPGECLGVLNQLLFRFGPRPHVTATYGVLDVEHQRWTQAVAGHPPALLRGPDGATVTLTQSPAVPLGVDPEATFPTQVFPLPVDATLLLYTDGLCERRGETLDAGIARLHATFDRACAETAVLGVTCDRVIDRMCGDTPPDDVALVAVRFRRAPTRVGAPVSPRATSRRTGPARRPR